MPEGSYIHVVGLQKGHEVREQVTRSGTPYLRGDSKTSAGVVVGGVSGGAWTVGFVAHISRQCPSYRPTRGNESGSAECSSCLAAATPCVGGEDKDTSNVECMSRRESSKEDKDQADLADGRMEG